MWETSGKKEIGNDLLGNYLGPTTGKHIERIQLFSKSALCAVTYIFLKADLGNRSY
jgi:hypothetical protein